MIRFLFLTLVSYSLYASEVPLVRLTLDKSNYHPLERSLLLAEVNVSPANVEYEFILDATLNDDYVVLESNSEYVWSAQSIPLTLVGTNIWNVSVYFIKKTIYQSIQDAIKLKKLALRTETNPSERANLETEITILDGEITRLRRFVKSFTIQFEVMGSIQ